MGMFSELLKADLPPDVPVDTLGQSLRKGWDSGVSGAASQLKSLGGLTAEALGANGVAKYLNDSAAASQQEAAASAPQIGRWADVHSLRDFGNYAAGVVGGSAPVSLAAIGAGLATGGGAVPAMLAGAAATAPFEMGDVIQKQRADPAAMQESAGLRLRNAALGGGASALAQGVVPGVVAGKLMGRGAAGAVNRSITGTIGHNIVGEGLMEGVAEGGGDIIKQFAANQNAPTDWESVKENAIGGMVGGGAMGTLGAAGDLAHVAPQKTWIGAKNMAQSGVDAVKDAGTATAEALDPAWKGLKASVDAGIKFGRGLVPEGVEMPQRAKDVAEFIKTEAGDQVAAARSALKRLTEADDLPAELKSQAKQWGANLHNTANRAYLWSLDQARAAGEFAQEKAPEGLMDRARNILKPATDMADTILNSESMEATKAFAGKTTDEIKRATADNTAKFGAWAKDQGTKLYNRVDLSDEQRKTLSEGLANVGDRAGQMKVATVAKAVAAKDKLVSGFGKLGEKLDKLMPKTDTKKSEDYSGFEDAILKSIGPMIAEAHPGVLDDPKAASAIGSTLRKLGSAMANGQDLRKEAVLTELADHIGPDLAQNVLAELAPLMAKKPEQQAAYFRQLQSMRDEEKSNSGLVDTITKYRSAEGRSRSGLNDTNREMAQIIRRHVAGDFSKGMTPEQAKFQDSQFMDLMEKEFGSKAKNIMAAAEREFKERSKETKLVAETTDSVGNEMGTKDGQSQYVGGGKTARTLVKKPELHRAEFGTESVADRIMKEHGAGKSVKFVTASEDPSILEKVPAFKKFKTDAKKAVDAQYPEYLARANGDEVAARSSMNDEVQSRIAEKVKFHQKEGHGLVELQDLADHDGFTTDELHGIRLDTSEHSTSPSRIDVKDGLTVDAVRLTKTMQKKIAVSDFGDQSRLHRMAESYMAGLAQLMADHGKFPVSGKTVIGTLSGKDVTAADAIRAMKSSDTAKGGYGLNDPKETTAATLERTAKKLRNDLRELYAEDQSDPTVADAIDHLEGKLHKTLEMWQEKANAEHFDRGMAESGKEDVGKDEQIHIAAAKHGENGDLVHRVNMDGTLVGTTQKGRNTAAKQSALAEAKAAREGSPDPKAVAAKKAAFLEKAASGDKGLIEEVSKSGDAKGLQRAADALSEKGVTGAVLDAVNKRLGELVQDPQIAYGLQTKKYSLMSNVIHADLEKEGFAATHDSPIRHAGDFDWREHTGKGEGHAAFGAGTYLSTAEGVHKSYKRQFTADVKLTRPDPEARKKLEGNLQRLRTAMRVPEFAAYRDALRRGERLPTEMADPHTYLKDGETIPSFDQIAMAVNADMWNRFVDQLDTVQKGLVDGAKPKFKDDTSPTYHVSVDIKPDELLNWDKPLRDQSAKVKEALTSMAYDESLDLNTLVLKTLDEHGREIAPTHVTLGDALAAAMDGANAGKFESAAGHDLYKGLTTALGSQRAASEFLQSYGILGHKYAAAGGRNDTHPNYVIYDDSKISTNFVQLSKQTANNPTGLTPKGRAQILDYLNQVTPWVQAQFPFLAHAGEFTMDMGQAVVRVSVHALNPTSVAYHESLHAFFQHLKTNSNSEVAAVLEKAAQSPVVMAQMKKLLANHPEALKQLSDPEERAAYMYQFWANGDLKMGEKATTLFGKIAEAFRKVMGMWSNDERALHIMEYFSSGEYAQNIGKPNVVRAALMEQGRSKAVENLKGMADTFMHLGEAVFGAGSANLRDSGIPALGKLADMIKLKGTDVGDDQGYLPASRIARSEYMNQLAKVFTGSEAHMREALEALQTATVATSPEARAIQVNVRKILDDVYKYLDQAGVKVGDMGVGKDYFPRQWDAHYLSTKDGREAFFAMARKYPQWADPASTYAKLIGAEGSELPTVDRPGFDAKKERLLSFISHADAAPFMNKDLAQTLNSYVTQATRRAEWSRRFGDDNTGLNNLLADARREGATNEQLDQAKKFVAGVNGTLGDDLNPTLRRYMGNMIVYQNIRLLPLAIFSSVVDPMGVMVRGGTVSDAWATLKRGIKEIPKGLKGDTSNDEMTQLAQDLDVIDNAMLQHSLGALYTQGVVSDTAKKINDAFFRFNMMEQFGRSMRVGATEAALKFMVKHADAKASPHSARWMAELGLKAGDVRVVNGRMATSEADGLTPEQATRVKVAVNRWVDGAVLRPDAADKPVWMNDPHFMLVSHLKQFVYSFQHTILDRMLHEARNGNYTPAMALASYVPVMFAADMIKGLLQGGGDEPEWKRAWGPGDYFMNATERAGLYGVGQFGVEALHGNWGALTGPTVEQLGEGIQVLGGTRQFKTFALHSLPANSVYATMAREGKNDTFDNPE